MLKRLGIAAVFGVALYGLARYFNNNVVVMIDSTGNFPDLLAPAPASLEEATDAGEAGIRTQQDIEPVPAGAHTAEAGPVCADETQTHGQVGDALVSPCP